MATGEGVNNLLVRAQKIVEETSTYVSQAKFDSSRLREWKSRGVAAAVYREDGIAACHWHVQSLLHVGEPSGDGGYSSVRAGNKVAGELLQPYALRKASEVILMACGEEEVWHLMVVPCSWSS